MRPSEAGALLGVAQRRRTYRWWMMLLINLMWGLMFFLCSLSCFFSGLPQQRQTHDIYACVGVQTRLGSLVHAAGG